MSQTIDKHTLKEKIIEQLKTVFDPEIPVNVFDLGLIYEINISDDFHVHILMTLTSPTCPAAEHLPLEINEKLLGLEGVKGVNVEITFDPPWNEDMMSEEARMELGFF